MKDGLRFVDSDMHVMEPPDLFDRYLDPRFKHRVTVPIGADGRPNRGPSGLTLIDGLPTSDAEVQNFPHVAENLLKNVPRAVAAQIFMGGATLYGFGEAHFAKADTAAARRAATSS